MLRLLTAAFGRFCCKSLFALVIKISFGRTRDFRVKMRGTSLSEDKLAGDRGNVIEATSIGGRWLDFFTAGKLAPGNFGLLQQYLPLADFMHRNKNPSFHLLEGHVDNFELRVGDNHAFHAHLMASLNDSKRLARR